MLSRPAKIALGAAAAAGGLWWLSRDRRVAHAAPARLRGDDTIAARVSNAATVVNEHAAAAGADLRQQASEVSSVVGTHAKLAGRDVKRAGAEVADALTGDLKAVKVRDTPALVGTRGATERDVDRSRYAAAVSPTPQVAPARDFAAGSGYTEAAPGRVYATGKGATAPVYATGKGATAPASISPAAGAGRFAAARPGDVDGVDLAAMTHVPQVEDALGESAMAIDATEGPAVTAVGGTTRTSAYYGAAPGSRYNGDRAYASPDERYSAAASRTAGYTEGYSAYGTDGRPALSDRAQNAKDIAHDHAVAARGDLRQAKRELGDIGSAHSELAKRDMSTAGSELKQALTGDRLPGGAVTRDTPDLLHRGARDEAHIQPTASTWSPEKRESPTLVDRLREAKDIVKAHGAAAVDDAKQWGHEVKEVVSGHGSTARTDVSNAGRELKDASSGAIAPAAPLRTPSITADEGKRF